MGKLFLYNHKKIQVLKNKINKTNFIKQIILNLAIQTKSIQQILVRQLKKTQIFQQMILVKCIEDLKKTLKINLVFISKKRKMRNL